MVACGGRWRVSAVRDVVIDLPADCVLDVVRDISLLEPLERKARHVAVDPETPTTGTYRIVGRLFRVLPWEGRFSYTQHGSGWHSEDLTPRADGWRISGGFLVSRIDDDTCRVTHYEDYAVPVRSWLVRRLLAAYMRRSQVGEMRDLADRVTRTVAQRRAHALPTQL